MDPATSRALFERLVRQTAYPGDACPASHILAGYLAESLSAEERRRFDEHLAECEGCRTELASLSGAAQWFEQNRDALLARARSGLDRPSQRPLPPQGLAVDRAGNIVSTPQLLALLTALQALARVQAARRRATALPGRRAAESELLAAPVVDALGQALLDDAGRSAVVDFHVIRAALEADGRLVVDLSTAQAAYWETPAGAFEVVASLTHEPWQITFPAEKIYADGRATIVARLLAGIEIDRLPPDALSLQVRRLRGG